MASLLRQIVAGPRARHPEAGLDLCYVTDHIIATSGPSGTYPQLAYRNPLSQLRKFLDSKHGANWAIWEFRAEGTGYPDSEVYNRIWHFPWPDHHPPPFALIPPIVASMRDWLKAADGKGKEGERVVVVHCKAGKGRSGTASCSYLISEEGWKLEDALKRFTERRMRPGFGAGVSIPSQLRWLGYVDRWTKHGKLYVERQVEVLEVHCWGLRDGVKLSVEGFVDDGRTIKTFHSFKHDEMQVVRGNFRNTGLSDVVAEMMGRNTESKAPKSEKTLADISNDEKSDSGAATPVEKGSGSGTATPGEGRKSGSSSGADVIFRPKHRIALATNDINIDFERRNRAAYGLTMVTSVAHVWFNAYFEGHGPENNGKADSSGVFEIDWDAMDGIKGSSRKGTRAFDKISVVWRALDDSESGKPPVVITEPKEGEPIKQTQPADWKGNPHFAPGIGKDLGLRPASPSPSSGPSSASASTHDVSKVGTRHQANSAIVTRPGQETGETEGVKTCGPQGEEIIYLPDDEDTESPASSGSGFPNRALLPLSGDLPQPTLTNRHNGNGDESGLSRPEEPSSRNEDSQGGQIHTLTQSPERMGKPNLEEGIVAGMQHISTSDLPDGKPEDELKTSTGHSLGHLKQAKDSSTSS